VNALKDVPWRNPGFLPRGETAPDTAAHPGYELPIDIGDVTGRANPSDRPAPFGVGTIV